MLSTAYFTSNDTWIAPEGVENILIIACGGGGGGGAARDEFLAGSGGGAGSWLQIKYVSVIPETEYTITIGEGGVGGIVSEYQEDHCGSDGEPTTFAEDGYEILFTALGGGGAGVNRGGGFNHGGIPWPNAFYQYWGENPDATLNIPCCGGGWIGEDDAFDGMRNSDGSFEGGYANLEYGTYGAGGGGAGPFGRGGDGGSMAFPNGEDAGNNTGAGGGGGNQNSTYGGQGGSGQLRLIF